MQEVDKYEEAPIFNRQCRSVSNLRSNYAKQTDRNRNIDGQRRNNDGDGFKDKSSFVSEESEDHGSRHNQVINELKAKLRE